MDEYRRARDDFARQAFMRHLGVAMTHLSDGRCTLELAARPEWTQQHGHLHGGIVATLADVAGGYAAQSKLTAPDSNLTVEMKINFLAPGGSERLIARAEVVKHGRTLTVCRSDVFNAGDGGEKLCATAQATYMKITPR